MDKWKKLQPWDLLLKRILFEQLCDIKEKNILDFGSGDGVTANHFALDNEVIAVEPSKEMIEDRYIENEYTQLLGSKAQSTRKSYAECGTV